MRCCCLQNCAATNWNEFINESSAWVVVLVSDKQSYENSEWAAATATTTSNANNKKRKKESEEAPISTSYNFALIENNKPKNKKTIKFFFFIFIIIFIFYWLKKFYFRIIYFKLRNLIQNCLNFYYYYYYFPHLFDMFKYMYWDFHYTS